MNTCLKIAVLLTLFIGASSAYAQSGPSFSAAYDFFPTSNLKSPDPGTFEEGLGIRISTISADLSLGPIIFSNGKTIWVNALSFHRFDLDYENWDDVQGGNRIENTQGVEYTLTLIRQLSQKWNITLVITPGLYSDFQGDLSNDDFNVSAAVIFGRQHGENFTWGFGAAYSFKYGEGFPIPLLALQWTNGSNLRIDMLLPMHAEFWYLPSQKLELGLAARVSGNQYHGDPSRYAVENPQMRYSVGTVGPSVKWHLSEKVHLTFDTGVTVLRRFEFFDGSNEQNSLDLKNSGFVRAGIQIGM